MPLKAKQIVKILSAPIRVSAFAASSSSNVVTTAITTALSTAGSGGVSVPLQISTGESVIGVITSSSSNRVEIYDTTTKDKLQDADANEVYARLTQSAGVYTLSYYSLVGGTETSYTFPSSTNIDFEFNYRFDFDRYPADAAISIGTRNISQDPRSSGGSPFSELVTVTAQNTLANLTKPPVVSSTIALFVNGEAFDSFSGAFSLSGQALTWSSSNAGMVLDTTDRVVARYFTNG